MQLKMKTHTENKQEMEIKWHKEWDMSVCVCVRWRNCFEEDVMQLFQNQFDDDALRWVNCHIKSRGECKI